MDMDSPILSPKFGFYLGNLGLGLGHEREMRLAQIRIVNRVGQYTSIFTEADVDICILNPHPSCPVLLVSPFPAHLQLNRMFAIISRYKAIFCQF